MNYYYLKMIAYNFGGDCILQSEGDEHLPFLLRCVDLALEAITADYERR